MANDATIEVILSLRDEMSDKLDSIEASINNFSKKSSEATEKVSNSLETTTNSLLAVGNAAEAFESIQSTMVNTELRLENAHERVLNAQDRLSNAQDNLNKLVESGTASADSLAKAQDGVDRASRVLTITENNEQRAKEQLLGTYIQIGLEVIRFTATIPQLINAMEMLTNTTVILEAISNPFVLTLGLLAAAAGVYAINQIHAASATTDFGNAASLAGPKLDSLTTSTNGYAASLVSVALGMQDVSLASQGKLPSNLNIDKYQSDIQTTKFMQSLPDTNSSIPTAPAGYYIRPDGSLNKIGNSSPINVTVQMDGKVVAQALNQSYNTKVSA